MLPKGTTERGVGRRCTQNHIHRGAASVGGGLDSRDALLILVPMSVTSETPAPSTCRSVQQAPQMIGRGIELE
jgi:hypothetical protein